ncbi:MAG: dihydroorotase [Deinococcales bacterium]
MSRLVIRNAHLLDGAGDHGTGGVRLEDGRIAAVGTGADQGAEAETTIDAGGALLTPAFLDLHAHLREPGQEVKEDLASGLAAAAAGGFGTVVSMANTTPTVDEPGLVAELVQKAGQLGQARLRPAAALSHGLRGETLTDFAALQQAGAVMITDDGIPVANGRLMRSACEYAAELGLVIQTHSEDPTLRGDGVMNEGEVSQELGLPGNPDAAEAAMVFRDCEIARLTGARVHIAHVTSKRALQVVEHFKALGAPVTCEVTPHHLTLTDAALRSFDPVFKVAPPLRTEVDVAYLRDALRRGVVDSIGTDHAPHTRAEKERDLMSAPFGLPNIEVAFPLLYTRLVETGELELPALLALLQDGPARVMGWSSPRLEVGAPADLVLLDLETERAVDPRRFRSKARFSPWAGERLRGWPTLTVVGGNVAYRLEAEAAA